MKKIVTLLMILTMMVMALAACTQTADDTSAEQTETTVEESTAVVDEVSEEATGFEFDWNGQKEVWAVVPTINAEGLMMICDAMGEALEAEGWTYVKKDAEGDPTKQVNHVEDAIAAGNVGALMVAAMSVEMLEDIVIEANEAGIIVVYLGAEPTTYDIASEIYTAYEITGYYAVLAAEEWAAQNNPTADDQGIPVAIDVYYDIQDGQYRSNAFVDRTTESETLYVFNTSTSYGDDAQTKGYDWAENQMNANPDLRIFLCYEPDCAYGVCSFLDQYASDTGVDLADFCVLCCYEDSDTPGYLEKAVADPSSTAFKGYVTYGAEGGPPVIGAKLAEEISGVADGSWAWGTYYYDNITSKTCFGFDMTWSMGEENPALQYKY